MQDNISTKNFKCSTGDRRRCLKGIHYRSDTNRTGAKVLSFYYPRLLHCLNQTLAVVLLSQHRVLSSKTVRPRVPCGARCIGHAVRTWSAVCSEAPHSQFGKGARPHLCMDEWNRPYGRMEWNTGDNAKPKIRKLFLFKLTFRRLEINRHLPKLKCSQ